MRKLVVVFVLLALLVPTLPAASQDEAVTLNFFHMTWLQAGQDVLDEAIAAFEAENPNIKVEQTVVSWGEAHSQFMISMAAGVAPDMAMMGGSWAVEFYLMGAFAPAGDSLPADFGDQFYPTALEAIQFDGELYGVPWEGATWGFFYRTDLFEAAGLDPNKPPTTWQELLEYSQKLTVDEDGNGEPEQWGLVFPAAGWEPDDYFLPFAWQADCEVAKEVEGRWVSTLDEPNCREALQFYYDLVHTYKVTPSSIVDFTWEEAKNAFVFGDAAMMFNGMWVIGTLQDTAPELDGLWATALNPAGPRGTFGALGYPNTVNVTAQSKHQAEAYKFLAFLHSGSPSWVDKYAMAHASLNWTKAYAETEFSKDPLVAPFVEAMNYGHYRPFAPGYEKFRQSYFNPALQALVLDEITPEEVAPELADAFNKLH
jgi:multiple sugar transport system substrate-binding protein